MIEHIPELLAAGVTSFKIEGRAKSAYYVAMMVNAYRMALDAAMEGRKPEPWVLDEVNKISHRDYSTGFFFDTEPGQFYANGGYIRSYEVCAAVLGWQDGVLTAAQRNRFFEGDTVEIVAPGAKPIELKVTGMTDVNGEPVASAKHAEMVLHIPCDTPVPEGALIRKLKP
jgi:putative protease